MSVGSRAFSMAAWHAIVMCHTHNNNKRQGGGETRAKRNETKCCWETTAGDSSAESWALSNELQQGIVGSARGKTEEGEKALRSSSHFTARLID